MSKPYMGKILNVDLTAGTCTEETIPDAVYENVLSGMGLAAYLLYQRIPAGADPLGPENMLGFFSGLLTGTTSLFTGRWMLASKSPLTGGWGDANCGGNFSPALKKSGYDAILVSGASDKPVYLLVNDGEAELRDAGHLWGVDAVETEQRLIEEVGINGARVACIGPAGEGLSRISGVVNDRGRIAARSGLGAVMGSKKLKAVVCTGKAKVGAHDPARMKELTKASREALKADQPLPNGSMSGYLGVLMRWLPVVLRQDGNQYKSLLRKWGTCGTNSLSIESGDAPVKNWGGSYLDFKRPQNNTVNPDLIIEREYKKYSCYACPLGCGGLCKGAGRYEETHKPEYESTIALGGLLLNDDRDSIFELNEMLNRGGMDTISAGGVVAFAIECYENGILTKEDTDGLELTWGNTQAIIALVEKMVKREGIGDLLADGVKVAAEKIGKGAEKYAMHAGGQELPMHDGRFDPGFAIHYNADPTPGKHTNGAYVYYEMYELWKKVPGLPKPSLVYGKDKKFDAEPDKAQMAAACSKYVNLYNAAGLCQFGAFAGTARLPLFDWLSAATGIQRTPSQWMEVGATIQTMRQQFNIKHGIEPRDFFAADRSNGLSPLKEGPNKGRTVQVEALLNGYWKLMGWDGQTGKPTSDRISAIEQALGISPAQ